MTDPIQTLYLPTLLQNHSQDMSGKVVVITGTTSGTGFVAARELAKLGANVILFNRASPRADKALSDLHAAVPAGKFQLIPCDLQSFASVHQACDSLKSQYDLIDVLINNAAVMAIEDDATGDGYDVQMQTNMLSHFLITKNLFPLLKKSRQGRIVNHSSMARLGAPLDPIYFGKNGGNLGGNGTPQENVSFSGPRWQRYHQTKLANFAFTYALKEKLIQAGVTNVISMVAHPGLALTSLAATTAKSGGMDAKSELMSSAQSAEDGAAGIIRAAMDPKANSGDFYGPETWTGFPDLRQPEAELMSTANFKIVWEGCEGAVGEFII